MSSKKLICPGRLTDRADTTKATSIHVRNEVISWLENNVNGNKQVAYNYLLLRGIQAVNAEQGSSAEVVDSLDALLQKLS